MKVFTVLFGGVLFFDFASANHGNTEV